MRFSVVRSGGWVASSALVLLTSACSGGSAETSADSETPTATASVATTPAPASDSLSPSASASGPLPGRNVDAGVSSGELLAVMGVAYDDRLQVVSVPGGGDSVGMLEAASSVEATGRSRSVKDSGTWHEVMVDDTTGWVPAPSLAWLGETTDETAGLLRSQGDRPKARSMLALGRKVAKSSAYNDPQAGSEVVVSAAPTDGDPGAVSLDVTEVPDDAVVGVRLKVLGTPETNGGYTLKSVEMTFLCGRGVDRRGFCL